MDLTELILDHPWLAPAMWAVLHSLDFFLTLVGARARLRGAHEVIRVDGSYELNPLFQKTVDRQRWVSARFLVTLVVLGAVLYFMAWACPGPEVGFGVAFLMGSVLFTRIAVVGRHLQNIWLYGRIVRRRGSVTGSVRYDRPTILFISAFTYGQLGALLGAAAAIVPDPWIIGGAVGNGLIATYGLLLGFRAAAKARREADPQAA